MNNYADTKLYAATFEKLDKNNKMFRARNDYGAKVRAVKISVENGYGKILRIYELNDATLKIKRAATRV